MLARLFVCRSLIDVFARRLCHNQLGEYFFDSCSWDGTEVATATAGYDSITTITSHPDHLCTADPVRPTCFNAGGNWYWSNLECAPLMEAGDRGYDEEPEGDERCTCHKISDGSTYACESDRCPLSHVRGRSLADDNGIAFRRRPNQRRGMRPPGLPRARPAPRPARRRPLLL